MKNKGLELFVLSPFFCFTERDKQLHAVDFIIPSLKKEMLLCFFLLFSCSLACLEHTTAGESMRASTGIKRGWQISCRCFPHRSYWWPLHLLSGGLSVSGGTYHPADKGNKESSSLQCQIKTSVNPDAQKGKDSPELAMTTLSQCRKIEQYNPNLNAQPLALLSPSEANKRIKIKEPEVSGERY